MDGRRKFRENCVHNEGKAEKTEDAALRDALSLGKQSGKGTPDTNAEKALPQKVPNKYRKKTTKPEATQLCKNMTTTQGVLCIPNVEKNVQKNEQKGSRH